MGRVDLHGNTVHEGWKKFRRATQEAYLNSAKTIVVIVGHGEMAKEFDRWCEADPYVRETRRLDRNSGAWRVMIKKKQNVRSN